MGANQRFQEVNGVSVNNLVRIWGGGLDSPRPPEIQAQPMSQTAIEGQTVSLAVYVTGFPPPSFQWLFNGAAIAGATNSILTLSDIRLRAAGIYEVAVGNTVSTVHSQLAGLAVKPLPIHPGTVDLTFNPGTGVEGRVNFVALQPDGGVILGGDFDSVDGVPRYSSARLRSDGTVDTQFAPEIKRQRDDPAARREDPCGRAILGD